MRFAPSDALTAAALAAIGLALAQTALSDPESLLEPAPVLAASAALAAAAGLLLGAAGRSREAGRRETAEKALRWQVAALEERVRTQALQLREMVTTDGVTGALTRPELLKRLDETVQRASRTGRPCALLLVEIQGFEEISATQGRVEGDEVLRTVARALQSATRGTDVVGRFGTDQFAVALGECDDPHPVVGRLHLALETAGAARDGRSVPVHVGGALLRHPSRRASPGDLVQTASDAVSSLSGQEGSRFSCHVLEGGGLRAPASVGR